MAGNFDSFVFPDDVSKAVGSRSPAERMQIITAARDFALTLPRANGKSGAIGFCLGGGIAWQGAADMPGLNVAISFYGTPPDLATMERIHAPVFAFDGDADLGTFSRMVAAAPDMKGWGNSSNTRSIRERRTRFCISSSSRKMRLRLWIPGRSPWQSSSAICRQTRLLTK